ncbi:hypothetical protein [Rhizohabitans arisaemae]|uniref:hypothetical protein n=1 Tax=Rhizohabitans arisaemae TaxID=2720610 RepID=UPI0024B06BD5|nr:hypothetical protein [Rhizohabitans arisaemae]
MDVTFTRTGRRRYSTVVESPGREPQGMNPAPGYDDHIPHDLLHYLVEAELGLTSGVYGRAAAGGGTFMPFGETVRDRRGHHRARRRQARSEARLGRADRSDMATSEFFAGVCFVLWRKRNSPPQERPPWIPPLDLTADQERQAERILARVDEIAPIWRDLGPGDSVTFTWPQSSPVGVGRGLRPVPDPRGR